MVLAADLDAPLLFGATDSSVESTGRTWQVLFRIDPDGSHIVEYTRNIPQHDAVAFERQDWESTAMMLPTFELGGVRVGATICHDQYLGLLPRFLARRGARIWINPSYDNVVDIKWSSILRLRAVENRFFSLCTLHHSSQRSVRPELTRLRFLLMVMRALSKASGYQEVAAACLSAKSQIRSTSWNSTCGLPEGGLDVESGSTSR